MLRTLLVLVSGVVAVGGFSAARQTAQPGPRMGHSLLYDTTARRVILLDGYSWIRAVSPDTPPEFTELWSWDGARWSTLPGAGPRSRAMGRAVFDSRRNTIVSFGGRVGPDEVPSDDTWEWHEGEWTRRSSLGDGPTVHIEMAFDTAREHTIRFGGALRERPGSLTWPTTTWSWDGRRWRRVQDAGPVGRAAAAMAYDSARREVVLFGGQGAADASGVQPLFGDTWIWNGKAWRRSAEQGPPARSYHAMTFDAARGVVVLYGGMTRTGLLDDMWTWNGQTWQQLSVATPSPGSRRLHAMTYDAARQRVVLYGGVAPDARGRIVGLGDTWEWTGASWDQMD